MPALWKREPHLTPQGPQWHGQTHNSQCEERTPRDGLANRIRQTHRGALEHDVVLGRPATRSSGPSA